MFRKRKITGKNFYVTVVAGLIALIALTWYAFSLADFRADELKFREKVDVSTHIYFEDFEPNFTNVTLSYEDQIEDMLFEMLELSTEGNILLDMLNKSNAESLLRFFGADEAALYEQDGWASYDGYALNKFLVSTEIGKNLLTVANIPDVRVLKARNALEIPKATPYDLDVSRYYTEEDEVVELIYFMVDSERLNPNCIGCGFSSETLLNVDFLKFFNLSEELETQKMIFPPMFFGNKSEQGTYSYRNYSKLLDDDVNKSLVIATVNRPFITEFLEEFDRLNFLIPRANLLKTSALNALDMLVPTDDFEMVFHVIPIDFIEPYELEKEVEDQSEILNEEDFFENMSFLRYESKTKLTEIDLPFADRTLDYVAQSGFNFMYYGEQYCNYARENIYYPGCEMIDLYSERNDLEYSPEKSAQLFMNEYREFIQERLKVFEYSGDVPIDVLKGNLHGLNLDSNEHRSYALFVLDENLRNYQNLVDGMIGSLALDTDYNYSEHERLIDGTDFAGYNFSENDYDGSILFQGYGPGRLWGDISMVTKISTLDDDSIDSGTLLLVAWDKPILDWMINDSSPLENESNAPIGYELVMKEMPKVVSAGEYFDVHMDLEMTFGYILQDDIPINFAIDGPSETNFPDRYVFDHYDREVLFRNVKFDEAGEYVLRAYTEEGKNIMNYRIVVDGQRDINYRVYSIPFNLVDSLEDLRGVAPEEDIVTQLIPGVVSPPTPGLPVGPPKSPRPEEEPTAPEEPELQCENQAEINADFDAINPINWATYYIYEDEYSELIQKYRDEFVYDGCSIPDKKDRPPVYVQMVDTDDDDDPDPPDDLVNVEIPINCYVGRRTYDTMVFFLENPTLDDQNVELRVEPDNFADPALEDNVSAGNADFWLFVSSIDSTGNAVTELPNPRDYGLLTQWHNTAIQIEIVAGNFSVANNTIGPFSLPAGEQRQVATVFDCGVDMVINDGGTIRVTAEVTD